jgi:hypothetical protein
LAIGEGEEGVAQVVVRIFWQPKACRSHPSACKIMVSALSIFFVIRLHRQNAFQHRGLVYKQPQCVDAPKTR